MVPALLIPASPPDPAWPESALAGTAPVREPSADEPSDDEPWDEEPPAGEALAEEPWDEEPPIEEPPADEAPAEEPRDEEPSVDEPPDEEPPADVVPAEVSPADVVPVEVPSDETPPADETPADAVPVEAPSAEEPWDEVHPDEESLPDEVADEVSPADVVPVEEPAVEAAPADKTSADEATVEESPDGVASAGTASVEEPPAEPPTAVVPPAGVAPVEEPPVDVAPVGAPPAEEPPAEEPWDEAPPADVTPAGTPLADEIPAAAPLADEPPAGVSSVGVSPAGVAAAEARPGTTRPGATRPAEPGWGTVLATTVRLWTRRRLANPRWRAAFALLLAVIVIGAIAIPLALNKASPGSQPASRGRSQASSGSTGPLGAAAARRQAAVWVTQQVNGDAIVACDPAMCGALQKAGVPAGRLIALGPGRSDPLGSDILVATAAVRSQFGSRLAGVYAPVVIAAFGTGTGRIEVRVEAPDGAVAYRAGLAADVAARKAAGAQMLHNGAIEASPAARRQLVAGQVDSRLLETLVTLSHAYRIDIISFGAGPASGVTPGVPLRFAEIAGAARGGHRPASLHTLRAFLSAQRTPYRPSWVTTERIASRSVLRVEYPAPSPLGLLGSHG